MSWQSTEFDIDREYVARVVGSQGSGINKIRDLLGVKVDVSDGSTRTWAEPGCWPGEPILAAPPGPGPHAQDAGVVLSLVLDARARRSFLLVLDAARFAELARVPLPHAVPLGFHGQWFPTG